ncbi:phosphate ABC transporter permease subunit PstC [Aeropyrum camini]|uniref:Phosphate transport system permease protein n=1 Tax=Aeropyrum camini SY1 = JCM 12091 TaxID=1198449 RepID=U3TBT2_9CREN|nr:phosphate ABC transporter permease subunit PstC [Aeropyrum camini]BAN89505.1 phosphate ABC transporter permease [Aeropyrum camini SY1 = JCM 12091]
MASILSRDRPFFTLLFIASSISASILVILFIVLAYYSIPAFQQYGFGVYIRSAWKSLETGPGDYGLLVPIAGTLVSASLAVAIGLPASLSAVIFAEEIIPPSMHRVREAFNTIVDVMTGLPTIVYGLWGVTFLAPTLKDTLLEWLYTYLSFIPLFSCKPLTGTTILTASLLLSLMIVPFIYAVVRESYRQIPRTYREAALSLGTTKYEYTRIMLGMVKPAILAGVLIGFGRAAGETVAVALVVGNTFNMPTCLLAPSYTVSSLIANQFANASLYPYMTNVLVAGGLFLLALGIVTNILGLSYLRRVRFHA